MPQGQSVGQKNPMSEKLSHIEVVQNIGNTPCDLTTSRFCCLFAVV